MKGWGLESSTPTFASKCQIISWSDGSNLTPFGKPGHSCATYHETKIQMSKHSYWIVRLTLD